MPISARRCHGAVCTLKRETCWEGCCRRVARDCGDRRGCVIRATELVLQSNNLLPPKDDEQPNGNSRKPVTGLGLPSTWTWEGVEAERARGMQLAQHFAALDGLYEEFPVSGCESYNGLEVLGEDLLGYMGHPVGQLSKTANRQHLT